MRDVKEETRITKSDVDMGMEDDEDNERWRVRNRWAKTYLFDVRIEYFTLGDHAASNRGPDLRHGCIRAPRGLAFLASM